MTDIDFEELDKAVSSLMDQRNQPESSPATDLASQSNSASSAIPATYPAPAPTPTPTAPAPSPAIKRPTGRFMDVVHPSSDMRGNMPKPSPSDLPSRESAPLQPVNDVQLGNFTDSSNVAQSEPKAMESESVDQPLSTDTSLDATFGAPEPMQSPFLDNVEVDKRPLGGASQSELEEVAESEQLSQETELVNETMPDPLDDWQAPAIEEPPKDEQESTNNDPWSAESDSTKSEPVATEPTPPELSAEVLALESDGAQTAEDGQFEPKAVKSEMAVTPQAPGDIPVQYAASAADEPEPSAVFEAAAEEPKELQHPAKKKSGWMVIVWILLLLIVGVGGGVAVWFFLLK